MIQTKTRTLQLEFADAAGNSVVYSLKNPKEGLDKAPSTPPSARCWKRRFSRRPRAS